jgi:hypothetical protein
MPAGTVVPSGQVIGGGGGGGGGGGQGVPTGSCVPSAQVCIAGGGGGLVAQAARTIVPAAASRIPLIMAFSFSGECRQANETVAVTFRRPVAACVPRSKATALRQPRCCRNPRLARSQGSPQAVELRCKIGDVGIRVRCPPM